MNIDQLRYFRALAGEDSIAAAARRLFISTQGLNKAVGSLEQELGVELVARGNRGTSLTPQGQRFLQFAEDVLGGYDAFIDDLASEASRALTDKPIVVCATSYVMNVVLDEFAEDGAFPDIHFEEMQPAELAKAASSPDWELSRVFLTSLFDDSPLSTEMLGRFQFDPLFTTEFGLVCHREFPLISSVLSPGDLRSIPFVCYRDDSIDWLLDRTFGGEWLQSNLLRASRVHQLLKAAEGKRAACLLDSFAYYVLLTSGGDTAQALRFVPIHDLPKVTCGFIAPESRPADSVETLFRRAFTAAFRHRNADYLRRYPLRDPRRER